MVIHHMNKSFIYNIIYLYMGGGKGAGAEWVWVRARDDTADTACDLPQ